MLVHVSATSPRKAKWSGPHYSRWRENDFTLSSNSLCVFQNVTCYTNSIVSRIHVNTIKLRNITCTLVATCLILLSLECHDCNTNQILILGVHQRWKKFCVPKSLFRSVPPSIISDVQVILARQICASWLPPTNLVTFHTILKVCFYIDKIHEVLLWLVDKWLRKVKSFYDMISTRANLHGSTYLQRQPRCEGNQIAHISVLSTKSFE